jgi:CheY-like chemotaxis protein
MSKEHLRILLVDDDDLNLDVLIECLKDEPYELVQAHDGVQALDLLRHDRKGFDAMVLDRMMPGMTGLEVMAELRADENFKWIPVVMQTSAASPSEICEGMEAGVFFYLTKPF